MEGECRLNTTRCLVESPRSENNAESFGSGNRKRKRTSGDPKKRIRIEISGGSSGRNNNTGRRIVGGRVYDSDLGRTCHWCRQKTVDVRLECSRDGCSIKFCGHCLRNRHGEDILEQSREGVHWVCPICRGGCGPACTQSCCNCGPCRKKRGLGCTGQMVQDARTKGFTNVHDYLIHLQTGEAAESIAERKVGRHWIAEAGPLVSTPNSQVEESEEFAVEPAETSEAEETEANQMEEDKGVLSPELQGKTAEQVQVKGNQFTSYSEEAARRIARRVDPNDWRREFYSDTGSDAEEDDYWGPDRRTMKDNASEKEQRKQNRKAKGSKRARKRSRKVTTKLHVAIEKDAVKQNSAVKVEYDEERPISKSSLTDDTDPECHELFIQVSDPPNDGEVFKKKLEKAVSAPFDADEAMNLQREVIKQRPVLKHRETRQGTISVATTEKSPSYLDQHPGLASKVASASLPEQLRLLRGFFFWIQHACHPGAFKPWLVDEDRTCGNDPECHVTAVRNPENTDSPL